MKCQNDYNDYKYSVQLKSQSKHNGAYSSHNHDLVAWAVELFKKNILKYTDNKIYNVNFFWADVILYY